jgi:hypothetical protein
MPTRTSGAIAAVESAAIDHQLMPCEPVWLATMTSRVLASVLVRSAAKKYSFQHNTLVEPPVVYADPRRPGTYLLLDGHLRVEALKERGESEVFCLLATDDEVVGARPLWTDLQTSEPPADCGQITVTCSHEPPSTRAA